MICDRADCEAFRSFLLLRPLSIAESLLETAACRILLRGYSMSLHPQEPLYVPEETNRAARAAFPKGSLRLQIADELGSIYADDQFSALFPRRGKHAEAPPCVREVAARIGSEPLGARIVGSVQGVTTRSVQNCTLSCSLAFTRPPGLRVPARRVGSSRRSRARLAC